MRKPPPLGVTLEPLSFVITCELPFLVLTKGLPFLVFTGSCRLWCRSDWLSWPLQESRDPNKYHWFFEQLMADPLKGEDGSFLQARWLRLVASIMAGMGYSELSVTQKEAFNFISNCQKFEYCAETLRIVLGFSGASWFIACDWGQLNMKNTKRKNYNIRIAGLAKFSDASFSFSANPWLRFSFSLH